MILCSDIFLHSTKPTADSITAVSFLLRDKHGEMRANPPPDGGQQLPSVLPSHVQTQVKGMRTHTLKNHLLTLDREI